MRHKLTYIIVVLIPFFAFAQDEDLELWISRGIPAFLGLRFFEEYYGKASNPTDYFQNSISST